MKCKFLLLIFLFSAQWAVDFDDYLKLSDKCEKENNIELTVDYLCHMRELRLDDVNINFKLANCLTILNRCDEAEFLYRDLLDKGHGLFNVWYNLAITLKKQNKMLEAVKLFEELIKINPNCVEAHCFLGTAYLSLGEFEKGLREVEWRLKLSCQPKLLKLWDGSDLKGKTVLIRNEGGLGDVIQFIRYAQLLKQQGAKVVLEIQKPLINLLANYKYIDAIVDVPDIDFDFQIPIMSLLYFFNKIVVNIPYLQADPTLVDFWHKELESDKNFKVGINWSAKSSGADVFEIYDAKFRCVPLKIFKRLSEIRGISLYSLQKITGVEQLKDPENNFIRVFEDLDEKHGRFMDTAAIMKNLDLVITVDSATAHLAGALGVQTWVLLPFCACWRWMLDRSDNLWYPTVRLFRQPKSGDWESVSMQVFKTLKAMV